MYFPHFSQLYSKLSTPDCISSYFRLIVSFTQSRLSQLLYFFSQHQPPSLLMQYYSYFTALILTISFSILHLISIISSCPLLSEYFILISLFIFALIFAFVYLELFPWLSSYMNHMVSCPILLITTLHAQLHLLTHYPSHAFNLPC